MNKAILGIFIAILLIPNVSFAQTPVQDREVLLQIVQTLLLRIQELQAQQAEVKKEVKKVKKEVKAKANKTEDPQKEIGGEALPEAGSSLWPNSQFRDGNCIYGSMADLQKKQFGSCGG